jgi:ABC-2 type transport system permease protein
MSRAFPVLKREYLEVVRKKSFIILTLLMPFLMAGMMFLPALLAVRGVADKTIAVVDGTGLLAATFEAEAEPPMTENVPRQLRAAARSAPRPGGRLRFDYHAAGGDLDAAARPLLERLQRGGAAGDDALDGVVVIPSGVFDDPAVALTYYSRSSADFMTQERLGSIVNRAVTHRRLAERGIAAADADRLLRRVRVEGVKLSRSGEQTAGGELNFVIGLLFVIMLMLPTFAYGQEVMRGIVQEKTERVVEILVSSVSPMALLSGKILGLAAVGLTQVAVWFGLAAFAGLYVGAAATAVGVNLLGFLTVRVVLSFLVFYVLGYLMFVCVYAVGGAVSNSEKEAQQFMAPIMIVTMIPWILAMPILQNPDSRLAVGVSMVPFFAPFAMFMRVLVGEPPLWQVVLAVVLAAAMIVALFWATAKIFRVGILSYGKRPTIVELWRWLKVA